ncbi:GNAT family acetyltransferase [Limosilactobacillus frumenti DSM 13145]|uniref:GNAT family acetyltransferase n=1 Tax=Limosilactobacillus frumenti DSM 13145 TaxID=1423746 RepID=A0A0R1P6Q9_9LACO|nr:GNAT family N-acetyltransferase [Limosilactobacillus frumenti]KRL26148.1 GNAT family acetyltransferase [Limosilactobacillus frumenti DSM 13145]MBA2913667.1 GNAT family N-acetyltransferase [Limosilactobacillus frumenti]QFG72992.1 GNAT family N-acetyltransferase [Limosilactobacillus frumenti]
MEWLDKTFDELTTRELFDIYYLRTQVFNGEQHSTYPDPDQQDLTAHHVLAMDGQQLVAYARYFPVDDENAAFGRVVVDVRKRRVGVGTQLINHVVTAIQHTYPDKQIKIHAQQYVEKWYAKLGFKPVGQPFMEAERRHIQMVYGGEQ